MEIMDPRKRVLAQIAKLKSTWEAEQGDRAHAKRLRRMASGDWIDDIPAMPAEPGWHAEKNYRQTFAPGLLQLAIRQLTTLYNEEPVRTLEVEGDVERQWAEESVWGFGLGLSTSMRRADALTRLQGTTLLYPLWKPSATAARDIRTFLAFGKQPEHKGPDGVEVLVIGRECFAALQNEYDPRHAEAVIVRVGSRRVGGQSVPVFDYWDRLHYARLEDWKPIPIGEAGEDIVEHGMSDHPFVVCRNDEGELQFYAEPLGGKDLWHNMRAIGSLFREYGWTAKLQRGQPYLVGELEQGFSFAPDTLLKLSRDSQFGIAQGGADLQGMREALLTHLEIFARTLGLPTRTYQVESSSGMSGVAIAMDRALIEDDRRQRAPLGLYWERQTHRKIAMVYEAATGHSHGGVRDAQYRALPIFTTYAERLTRLQFLRGERMIARLDTLRELYPGVPDEELEERLTRADEELEDLIAKEEERADKEAERQSNIAQAGQPPAQTDPLAGLFGPPV